MKLHKIVFDGEVIGVDYSGRVYKTNFHITFGSIRARLDSVLKVYPWMGWRDAFLRIVDIGEYVGGGLITAMYGSATYLTEENDLITKTLMINPEAKVISDLVLFREVQHDALDY